MHLYQILHLIVTIKTWLLDDVLMLPIWIYKATHNKLIQSKNEQQHILCLTIIHKQTKYIFNKTPQNITG